MVDNTSASQQEKDKLLNADVSLISGGNTFQLLSNLRESGLDSVIVKLSHKQDVTLAGFRPALWASRLQLQYVIYLALTKT